MGNNLPVTNVERFFAPRSDAARLDWGKPLFPRHLQDPYDQIREGCFPTTAASMWCLRRRWHTHFERAWRVELFMRQANGLNLSPEGGDQEEAPASGAFLLPPLIFFVRCSNMRNR